MAIKRLAGLAVVGLAMWAGIAWAVVSMASAEDSTQEVVVPCPTDSTLCETDVSPEMVKVPCPSEDSCAVDYHDGAYHITQVVP